jgi:hypothetical protein
MTQDDTQSRLELLERQQSLQTDALRQIIEGNWTGATGAAGLVVALMGGTAPADFSPMEYPPNPKP